MFFLLVFSLFSRNEYKVYSYDALHIHNISGRDIGLLLSRATFSFIIITDMLTSMSAVIDQDEILHSGITVVRTYE